MSSFQKRYLFNIIEDMAISYGKMAFISGPRQVGKTTLAKALLADRGAGEYQTWDDPSFRKKWVRGPDAVVDTIISKKNQKKPILIFDELHKAKNWKSSLKGVYDLFHNQLDIIVTGSARLNVFRKGGDSLLGRYFSFQLNPLSVAELLNSSNTNPKELLEKIFHEKPKVRHDSTRVFLDLLEFSGFPDPYFAKNTKFSNLWRTSRLDKIIREDLRDLSRIPELSQVEMLAALLPERVKSPVSIQSLREDLEVSHDTVKRWMTYLESLYYIFSIRPYSKSMVRSLKKEPKIYLYDWTELEDVGAKFENFIAVHLKKSCDFWCDAGHGKWQLHYLRNKEKQEVDFLITFKDKAFLSVECKVSDTAVDNSVMSFAKHIGLTHHIQVVQTPGIWKRQKIDDVEVLVASADLVLKYFV